MTNSWNITDIAYTVKIIFTESSLGRIPDGFQSDVLAKAGSVTAELSQLWCAPHQVSPMMEHPQPPWATSSVTGKKRFPSISLGILVFSHANTMNLQSEPGFLFHCSKGGYKEDRDFLYTVSHMEKTRGNRHKLLLGRFHLDTRRKFLT